MLWHLIESCMEIPDPFLFPCLKANVALCVFPAAGALTIEERKQECKQSILPCWVRTPIMLPDLSGLHMVVFCIELDQQSAISTV